MTHDSERTTNPVSGPRRRLTRSSQERMWAGVAGGLAEYFDVDPVLIRLIWVAAAIVTGGLAIPAYLALWLIMPRQDRLGTANNGHESWHEWSDELRAETQRFAHEARRVAVDVTEGFHPQDQAASRRPEAEPVGVTQAVGASAGTAQAPDSEATAGAAISKERRSGEAPPWSEPLGGPFDVAAASVSAPFADVGHDHPDAHRRRRAGGLFLIVLGVAFLANNAGLIPRINWGLAWPLFLVMAGVFLLARQGSHRRRW